MFSKKIVQFLQDKQIQYHIYDVAIIGAGGAGLATAIYLEQYNNNYEICVISKVEPLKSHTIAAQGGINAVFNSSFDTDHWRWHAYDTLKAADFIADDDVIEILCRNSAEAIYFLEEMGVRFDRNPDNSIAQKIYGGQTTHYGQGNFAKRACHSADKTGQAIMQALYKKTINSKIKILNNNFAIDLLISKNKCYGFISIDIESGAINIILANNVIIATGGYSQIYNTTTSASICTGDGNALAFRAGLALQDMEFIQFHPTAIREIGLLITEAARSAQARLLNCNKERFMEKYAPNLLELASRDVVARAIATEIAEGRGAGANKDHIWLDLTHLSCDYIKQNLPLVFENCQIFLNIDPSKHLIPVAPAAHYTMGGIMVNQDCQVLNYNFVKENEEILYKDNNDELIYLNENQFQIVEGLYAVGETACLSIHGANRLGCNSLLELIVFAKVIAKSISDNKFLSNQKISRDYINNQFVKNSIEKILQERFNNLLINNQNNIFNLKEIKNKLKILMQKKMHLFRDEKNLIEAIKEIEFLKNNLKQFSFSTENQTSLVYNSCFVEYLELENMLICAEASTRLALWRKESRGAHWRIDYPGKEEKYQVHSVFFQKNGKNFSAARKVKKLDWLQQHIDLKRQY